MYLYIFHSVLYCFCLGCPREGEDRTGALLADREAAQYELTAKTAELDKKEAVLEKGRERAAAEAKEKVCVSHMCPFFVCVPTSGHLFPVRIA